MAEVRPAGPAELESVDRLLSDSGLPLDGLADAWRIIVAEDDHGLAGVAALERYADGDGPVFLLRSVAVRPDRRTQGMGGTLVQAALDEADSMAGGVARVGLLTETAAGYFDRFGFRAVPRDRLPAALSGSAELSGACPETAQAYVRP